MFFPWRNQSLKRWNTSRITTKMTGRTQLAGLQAQCYFYHNGLSQCEWMKCIIPSYLQLVLQESERSEEELTWAGKAMCPCLHPQGRAYFAYSYKRSSGHALINTGAWCPPPCPSPCSTLWFPVCPLPQHFTPLPSVQQGQQQWMISSTS